MGVVGISPVIGRLGGERLEHEADGGTDYRGEGRSRDQIKASALTGIEQPQHVRRRGRSRGQGGADKSACYDGNRVRLLRLSLTWAEAPGRCRR